MQTQDYDNEKVVSLVNSNIEVSKTQVKICTFTCPECGKEIAGMNRNRVGANAKAHVASKHSEIYSGDER